MPSDEDELRGAVHRLLEKRCQLLECFICAYFCAHPNARIENLKLVEQLDGTKISWWIEEKSES